MKNNYFIFFLLIGIMLTCCAKKSGVTIGQKAPNFSLSDTTGKMYNLSDFKGKKIALYFFPKTGTPYCTKQACSLRDNFSTLKKKGIIVVGVSNDSLKKQQRFAEKHQLPFLLLSDPCQTVIKEYGAKGLLFNKRKTFLINEKGNIVGIISKIDITNHAQQILDGFAAAKEK